MKHIMKIRYILPLLAFLLISGTVIYRELVTDSTLTGLGTLDSPLKVDTSVISTKANVLVVGVTKVGSVSESVTGVKTFSSDPIVPAETYGDGWNGSNEVPTKNDTYDEIEALTFNSNIALYTGLGSTIKATTIGNIGYPVLSNTLTDGQARYVAVYIPKAITVTGVKWWQTTQGSYTADQNNYIGLYSYSGGTMTQVAISTNDGNLWKGGNNSWQTTAFSSTYAASAGIYFVAFLWNASSTTTTPTIGGANNLLNTAMASFDFTNSALISGSVAAQNTLPSTQAMSGVSGIVGVPALYLY